MKPASTEDGYKLFCSVDRPLVKPLPYPLIEVHEVIDNFSEIDKGGEHYGFCHRRHAVMNLIFFKGQVKSPILHNTRDGSEFYVPYPLH